MTYRQKETEAVLSAWSAGQSVSVIGVGSAGKTNFVQHLARSGSTHAPASYWPERMAAIVADANLLGPLPEPGDPRRRMLAYWAGCELLLHRTFMALYPFDTFTDAERTTLYQAYEALQDGSNALYAQLALRYLELGLSVALRAGYRLVFLFDEFERFASLLPEDFFQSLRGLRDLNKRQVMYATMSRSPLPDVMHTAGQDLLRVEPFCELFNDHTVYLGAHAPEDAQAMVQDLLGRRQAALSLGAVQTLLNVTQGHPGLLRACVNAVVDDPTLGRLSGRDLCPALLDVTAVLQECSALWNSLSTPEQSCLLQMASGRRPALPLALMIQQKGLGSRKYQIQPPVFALFVARVQP